MIKLETHLLVIVILTLVRTSVDQNNIRCQTHKNCLPNGERCMGSYCEQCLELNYKCTKDFDCCDYNLNLNHFSAYTYCDKKCKDCKRIGELRLLLGLTKSVAD